jgi:hypothetical protein
MILSNNQTYKPEPTVKHFQPNVAQTPSVSKGVVGFNGSMIGRIHTIKPGCGSCGR